MRQESKEYKGHRIEIREREGKPEIREREGEFELVIDNKPVSYGQLPEGLYFLDEYAFDWTDNLMELAQRFIDYQEKADKIRRERKSGKGGK